MLASDVVLQFGLPEFVPDLIAAAGTFVLFLMLLALAGFAYKSLTGGVEWPEDRDDDDGLRRGDDDDEWDYY
jgi:hypothetical protein